MLDDAFHLLRMPGAPLWRGYLPCVQLSSHCVERVALPLHRTDHRSQLVGPGLRFGSILWRQDLPAIGTELRASPPRCRQRRLRALTDEAGL
jgi:hypothetical protein